MNKNIIVLYIIGIIAIILSLISIFKYNGNGETYEQPDLVAKEVVLKEENGIIKWKYSTESNWKDLYNLINAKGADGKDGVDGKDGTNGKNGTNGINGTDGKNGVDGKDGAQGPQGETGAIGPQGPQGEQGLQGIQGIQGPKGDQGETGPQGEQGPQGIAGTNGKEVELRAEGTVIQWKYTDDDTWKDLIDVASISGGGGSGGTNGTIESIVEAVDGDSTNLGCYNKGTSCTNGTRFSVKVNDSTTLDFYVIDSDADTVTLISASNIGNSEITTVAWYSASSGNNSYGPATALTALNNVTSDWTNISPLNYTYNNSGVGYKKLVVTNGTAVITDAGDGTTAIVGTTRARLLTYEEAYSFGCRTTANASNCPSWLYANLNAENNSLTPYGFWLLTSYTNNNRVYNIRNTGILANNSPNDTTGRGLRPVIIINKI